MITGLSRVVSKSGKYILSVDGTMKIKEEI